MTSTESTGGRILVRMPRTLHRALQRRAEAEGVSLNQFVVSALAQALGTDQGEAPTAPSTSEQLYEQADRLAEQARATAELRAEAEERAAQHDDQLASLGEALTELAARVDDHEAGLAVAGQRLTDLEDEWLVAHEGGFLRGFATGTALVDPGQEARRARLRERAAERFGRVRG